MKANRILSLTTLGLNLAAGLFVGAIRPGQAAEVQFTNSAQLDLANNIAAVNFYYGDPNDAVSGPIQGVNFANFNVSGANGVVTPLPGAGGHTLTIEFPHTSEPRNQFTSTTITGTGADTLPAQQLASSISYFRDGDTGSMSFAFGSALANRPVDVQIIGGDEGWGGTLTAKIGSTVVGSLSGDGDNTTAELFSFKATTDSSGNLVIGLFGTPGPNPGSPFAGIAGAIVSVPEPSTLMLGLFSLAGLVAMLRRRHSV